MKIFIFGAGGHGKVVCDVLIASGAEVAAFVDDSGTKTTHFGLSVIRESEIPKTEIGLIVAVGVNNIRANVVTRLTKEFPRARFVNAIHPQSTIAKSVKLGVGNVVASGAILGPDVVIGDHCVINTGSQVDHDGTVGNFASVAPGAILGGAVRVGAYSYIALGANVIHGMTIGEHTVIGAGSVVVKPIGDKVVALGSPCKVIRARAENDKYL